MLQNKTSQKEPQQVPLDSDNELLIAPDVYTSADLLIDYLAQIDVEFVFGIPGGPIEPFYDALARSERAGSVRAIVARHETGAAFMADGYARNSGRLGVCCGTVGPGTTNLITGVASAYENQSPLLVITAQTSQANFGRGAAQESTDTGINTVAMLSHCTHYSSLVSHVGQLEQKIISAVVAAFKTPQGPAHLSIPLDIMRADSSVNKPSYDLVRMIQAPECLDGYSLSLLTEKIAAAKDVVFLVGEGAASAIDIILQLAILLDARVVTTPHAKGLVSAYHPLYRGVVGFAGHESAIETLRDEAVDLVLTIGTALQEAATNSWVITQTIGARMVHIDSSDHNLAHSPFAQLHVQGNIETIFTRLLREVKVDHTKAAPEVQSEYIMDLPQADCSQEANVAHLMRLNFELEEVGKTSIDKGPIKPQRLMHILPKLLPLNTHYLCDSGNSMAWAIHYLHPQDRRVSSRRAEPQAGAGSDCLTRRLGRREFKGGVFWTCLEFGSMGWAVGSSIGTSLARPNLPTVCLTGDGSMLMSGGDITVALQEQLNVIFVILNDSEYGMVKHGQNLGGGESIGYSLPNVDFVAWGQSMGIEGYSIRDSGDLLKLDLQNIAQTPGPKILDVYIDPLEVPPIKSRMKALGRL